MRALTLRGRLRTAVGTVLLAMAGALGLAQDAAAQRELRVEDFSVTLTVHEDGTMDVLESIRYGFTGSWNGVFRDIPISYQSPSGLNFRLVLDDISVRNEAGETLRFETSRERHYRRIKVWVPGAQNTSRTVDFRYTVKNPLRFFDGEGEGFSGGYDELYWNATGDESEISIDQASVTVHLPAALTGVQARAYTGSYGSTASDATITEIQDGFYVQSLRGFAPREGLTVDLAWNPGVIRRPTIVDRTASTFRANWVLLLPILSFFLMWKHWKAKGKDPDRRAVAPQYKPPEGMTPAEIGTLVDNRPDMKDITALIVDLAVRGYIRIERREDKGLFGLTSSEEYTFHRVKKSESRDLPGFEKKLLGELFRRGTGDRVKTEDLESDFYSEIKDLKERIFTQLIEAGYYKKRPDHVVARVHVAGDRSAGARDLLRLGVRRRPRGASELAVDRNRGRGLTHPDLGSPHVPAHEGGDTPTRAHSGLPGVPQSRRGGSFQADDRFAPDVRALPATRHGPGRGEPLGPSVRGHLHRTPELVRRGRPRALQFGGVVTQHDVDEQPDRIGDDVSATQFGRIGVRRRGRRIQRGRLRRRRNRGILTTDEPIRVLTGTGLSSLGMPTLLRLRTRIWSPSASSSSELLRGVEAGGAGVTPPT